MTLIRNKDVIQSVAEALQYISYYHPADFVRAVSEAYEMEESAAAKDAMAQILINSRLCAEGKGRFARTPVSSQCSSKWVCSCSGRAICHSPR